MDDRWDFVAEGPERRNAALFFQQEAYSSQHRNLMGRHVAGESFLRALVRYAASDDFCCVVRSQRDARTFRDLVASLRPAARVSFRPLLRLKDIENLHVADPRIAHFAWQRRRTPGLRCAISGVTHTTASPRAMDAIAAMITGPVAASDALICSSRAVKATVLALLEEEEAYLARRVGAGRFTRPMLPIIPLGVEPAEFKRDPVKRQAWRQRLGVEDEDVAVLYMGRLSAHAKANPVPLYRALAIAAARSKRRVHLVQCGWFAMEWMDAAFRQAAHDFAGKVNCVFLDGREADVRDGIWSAADIFTLLADNIQETFGIAPLEAMAAGVPVVVSDWDGFKDTVRDGVDGFRIPTLAPPRGVSGNLAARISMEIDSYDVYAGRVAQSVQVDIEAAAAAFSRLIEDSDLRRRMGEAARARVESCFAWRLIVGAYEDLWAEQRARLARETIPPVPAGREAQPTRPDPFRIFGHYATRPASPDDVVRLAPHAPVDQFASLLACKLMLVSSPAPAFEKECRMLLSCLEKQGEISVGRLLELFDSENRASRLHVILWLCKVGIFSIERAVSNTGGLSLTEVNEPQEISR